MARNGPRAGGRESLGITFLVPPLGAVVIGPGLPKRSLGRFRSYHRPWEKEKDV
jgi:hypothetical protein